MGAQSTPAGGRVRTFLTGKGEIPCRGEKKWVCHFGTTVSPVTGFNPLPLPFFSSQPLPRSAWNLPTRCRGGMPPPWAPVDGRPVTVYEQQRWKARPDGGSTELGASGVAEGASGVLAGAGEAGSAGPGGDPQGELLDPAEGVGGGVARGPGEGGAEGLGVGGAASLALGAEVAVAPGGAGELDEEGGITGELPLVALALVDELFGEPPLSEGSVDFFHR